MHVSFLGKSFTFSMPIFEAFKASEVKSLTGHSKARNPFHIAYRHQPSALTQRSAVKGRHGVQNLAMPKSYKIVGLHWIADNNLPTPGAFSADATARTVQSNSREIEVKLPKIDAASKLLLFVQVTENCGTAGSQVYSSRVVKVDKVAKKALIQVSSSGSSTDWTANLKFKLVSLNSICC